MSIKRTRVLASIATTVFAVTVGDAHTPQLQR